MPKTFLNLGRTGDIVALLPVLKAEHDDSGKRPRLIVSQDYESVLDGVSYVEKVVYDGPFEDIAGALKFAKSIDPQVTTSQVVGIPDVVVSQVYGHNHHPKIITDSFQCDLYRLAGRIDLWPKQPKLVFDKRDAQREAQLTKGLPKDKPWIVVSTGGISSPFPFRDLLWEIVNNCLPDYHVIDLGKIHAKKFYDILSIMEHENAEHLILTDSAPLHLSFATQKPVHALVTDSPSLWHGSAWRPFYASYSRYKNFPRDVIRMLDLIRNPPRPPKHKNIVHVYQRTPWATGDEARRNAVAAKSWEKIGMVDCGLDDNCFVRTAAEMVADETKRIPMIKEMIRLGCLGRQDYDIIVLTNTDTCIASDMVERINGLLPCYAYRNDFKHLDEPLSDSQICAGEKYPGCDFFAFTAGWWRKNHEKFPDMILGREAWDRILRTLMISQGGREIPNLIYHERHASFWEDPANYDRDPSNLRNRKLAREWLQERKIALAELENANYEGRFKKPDFSKLKT